MALRYILFECFWPSKLLFEKNGEKKKENKEVAICSNPVQLPA